jgi:hypothetical protein
MKLEGMNVVGSTLDVTRLSRRATKAKRTMEMRRFLASPTLVDASQSSLECQGNAVAHRFNPRVTQKAWVRVDMPGLKFGAYVDVRFRSLSMSAFSPEADILIVGVNVC